jgi:hypothetical protein
MGKNDEGTHRTGSKSRNSKSKFRFFTHVRTIEPLSYSLWFVVAVVRKRHQQNPLQSHFLKGIFASFDITFYVYISLFVVMLKF